MTKDLKETLEDGYSRPYPRVRTRVEGGRTLTAQEYKKECDINNIVNMWRNSGIVPNVKVQEPLYVDVSEEVDLQTSINRVIDAQNAFMTLDPNIRKEFNNDPVELLKFLSDEKNKSRAEELGLIVKKQDVSQASAVAPQGKQVGDASNVEPAQSA